MAEAISITLSILALLVAGVALYYTYSLHKAVEKAFADVVKRISEDEKDISEWSGEKLAFRDLEREIRENKPKP